MAQEWIELKYWRNVWQNQYCICIAHGIFISYTPMFVFWHILLTNGIHVSYISNIFDIYEMFQLHILYVSYNFYVCWHIWQYMKLGHFIYVKYIAYIRNMYAIYMWSLYYITGMPTYMASGINIYSVFWISKIIILDIQNKYFGYQKKVGETLYFIYPE